MSVNSVNNNTTSGVSPYEYQKAQQDKTTASTQKTETEKQQISKDDGFVKQTYKPDMEKVNKMKADLANNTSAFRMMVQGMFQKQGTAANTALGLILNIDEASQRKAQEAIGEDGEWGVEQTANRILEFAKALSGGDPSKIELLKGGFEAGYKAAEKVWGGELPEISKKTYDRVQEGFKEWANPTTEVTNE